MPVAISWLSLKPAFPSKMGFARDRIPSVCARLAEATRALKLRDLYRLAAHLVSATLPPAKTYQQSWHRARARATGQHLSLVSHGHHAE